MRYFLTVLLSSILVFASAQVNLVPNPSFEFYDTCPNNGGQIYYSEPWFGPTQGTTDYFNACDSPVLGTPQNLLGYQIPHSGIAYAGFFASYNDTTMGLPNYREYVEVKLDSALRPGIKYFVSFYLSLADSMNFATDEVGVYFSSDSIQNDSIYGYMLYQIPQVENVSGNFLMDKSMWMKISGSFIAQGGESYLTIGNFYTDINTTTVPVSGGATPPFSDWSGGYYYLDDVCISTDSLYSESWTDVHSFSEAEINVFPNPASTAITIESCPINSYFSIVDVMGREMAKGILGGQNDQINVTSFENGIYFLTINNEHLCKIIIDR